MPGTPLNGVGTLPPHVLPDPQDAYTKLLAANETQSTEPIKQILPMIFIIANPLLKNT